jgi:hypothetical protein
MAESDPQARSEEGGAAEAFEALRAEVAGLRGDLAGGTGGPADYSPTLAAMAASLGAIATHPALRLTPEDFGGELRRVSERTREETRQELSGAVQRFDAAGLALETLAGSQLDRREHVRQVAIMTAVGAVVGIAMWVCFSGPLARALPASWAVPERMAAATLRLDRWDAGERLMQTADAQRWVQVDAGAKLEQANVTALGDCQAAALKTGKPKRCVVTARP